MADKARFKWVTVISCILLFAIYASLTVAGYQGRYSVPSPDSVPFFDLKPNDGVMCRCIRTALQNDEVDF